MRYEDSARRLHIHPNTLRHRLRRFEQVTDCSLRDMSTLIELWWALERTAMKPEQTSTQTRCFAIPASLRGFVDHPWIHRHRGIYCGIASRAASAFADTLIGHVDDH
jgi:hypothetical protein